MNIFFKVYFGVFGKPKVGKNLKKTIALYKGHDFNELFSLIRVWDAPFEKINKMVPKKGVIVDLGCGDGILANYLGISEKKRKVLGVELNKARLKEANKGVKNVGFRKGDIVKGNYPKADCILLTHVLHHLSSKEDQEVVLKFAKKKLKKGGMLIITEIIERPLLKLVFTWLTDAFTVPILFEGKLYDFSFRYRTENNWKYLLSSIGLSVKSELVHKHKPFSHVIFTASNEK